ncbi:MAG TPA: STAS domain-containing protein [Bacillota bacterium]|nr:STAS domain-containing protein [Bacillota bacterium]
MNQEDVNLHSQMVQNYLKIVVEGKMIYANSHDVKKYIFGNLKEFQGYIFDMTRLRQIDSTGFGVLINVAKRLNEKQRKMVIIIQDPYMKELFFIAKFHFILSIVATEVEAIEALHQDRSEKWSISKY